MNQDRRPAHEVAERDQFLAALATNAELAMDVMAAFLCVGFTRAEAFDLLMAWMHLEFDE